MGVFSSQFLNAQQAYQITSDYYCRFVLHCVTALYIGVTPLDGVDKFIVFNIYDISLIIRICHHHYLPYIIVQNFVG